MSSSFWLVIKIFMPNAYGTAIVPDSYQLYLMSSQQQKHNKLETCTIQSLKIENSAVLCCVVLPYTCPPLTFKHFPDYRAKGNGQLNPPHFEIEEINQIMNKSHNAKPPSKVCML